MVKLIILQLNNLSEIYYGKKMVFHRSFFFPVMKGLIGPNKKEMKEHIRLIYFKQKHTKKTILYLAYKEYEVPSFTASREMEEKESEQNCAPSNIASLSSSCIQTYK